MTDWLLKLGIVLLLSACSSVSMAQQPYPSRPVNFILPVPPGGALDLLARALAQRFNERVGAQLLIDNRPGADFLIAADACAKSRPDGYTVCMILRDSLFITPLLQKVPYSPERDFVPVTNMVYLQNVLVAHHTVPVKTFKELVEYSKANPDKLNWTAFGSSQMIIEWIKQQAGLRATFIRYKGQGEANKDFLAGRLQLSYLALGNANLASDINSGKVTGLIVPGSKRIAQIPNVPAFTEVGLADFEARHWLGLFMPAGSPREAINKMSAEFTAMVRSPDFIAKYVTPGGFDPIGGTPEEFAAFLLADRKVGEVFARLAPKPE